MEKLKKNVPVCFTKHMAENSSFSEQVGRSIGDIDQT